MRRKFCALLILLPTWAGCGGVSDVDPNLAPVRGTVTYHGENLTQGTVTFVPEDVTAGSTASAPIQPDGSYEIKTTASGAGALPGQYKVRIESWAEPPQMDGSPGKLAIPEKYNEAEKSGLTANVKAGETNEISFELTD